MLGHRIASLRKKMGISQTELAQKICISSSAIGMYEQGRREPSIAIIIALSRELNVSIDFLLTGRNWSQKMIVLMQFSFVKTAEQYYATIGTLLFLFRMKSSHHPYLQF